MFGVDDQAHERERSDDRRDIDRLGGTLIGEQTDESRHEKPRCEQNRA